MTTAAFAKPDDIVDCAPGGFTFTGTSAPPAPTAKTWEWFGVGNANLSGDVGKIGMDSTAPPNARLLVNHTDSNGVVRRAALSAVAPGTVITLTSGAATLAFTVATVVAGDPTDDGFVTYTGTTADNGVLALPEGGIITVTGI